MDRCSYSLASSKKVSSTTVSVSPYGVPASTCASIHKATGSLA